MNELECLWVMFNLIGDVVIVMDNNVIINFMNFIVECLIGWYVDDVKGRYIEEVMNLVDVLLNICLVNFILVVLKEYCIVVMVFNS